MQVILLERIEKLGQMGEVVDVKAGYARNFLLPQHKALRATQSNVQAFESRRVQLEADNLARRDEAEGVAGRIEGLTVVLTRQASESAQLYGSVTKRDIAEAVAEAGFTITRSQVALDRPIKTVGLHPIRVQLHPEVSVTITANVARTGEEAEAQARGEIIGADPEELEEPGEFEADAEAAAEETAVEETRRGGTRRGSGQRGTAGRGIGLAGTHARSTRDTVPPARCHEPRPRRLRRRAHPPGAERAPDARKALRLGRAG